MGKALSPAQAARVYDRIGRFQDWQAFYEGPAVSDLIAHAHLDAASGVFELGCGTGALAARLLAEQLPVEATYLGVDVSPHMVRLSRERLQRWAGRACVLPTDGSLPLSGVDSAYSHFLAVYVFDLLPEEYARAQLLEAARLLAPGGRVGLVSLAPGRSRVACLVSGAWGALWELAPRLTGGCRPVDLGSLLEQGWVTEYRALVEAWGVASEVIVATPSPRA
jgi:SAM-dependent methyltransferase